MSDLSDKVKLQTNKEKRNTMNKHTAMTIRLTIVVTIVSFLAFHLGMVAQYSNPEMMSTALAGMASVVLGIFAVLGWITVAVNFVVGEE